MTERNLYLMFATNYRQNRMSSNPPVMENYLELTRAECVLTMAFVYPKNIYGKDFWLSINEEWQKMLHRQRSMRNGLEQLNRMNLEVIAMREKAAVTCLTSNTCSLNIKNGYVLTLNSVHSRLLEKYRTSKLLLTRSRQTGDVVLMFNRSKGIEARLKHSRGEKFNVVVNCRDLACHLIELLELDAQEEYFRLNIDLLSENMDTVLFKVRKIEGFE